MHDIEGLGTLFSHHIPNYRNLFTRYNVLTEGKQVQVRGLCEYRQPPF